MKKTTIAVLLSVACLAPVFAQVAENRKTAGDRAWHQVVDNDNLAAVIAKARVSVVGSPASSPAPAAAPAASASSRPVKRASVSLAIAGVCDNKPFAIPTWCPSGGEGVVGGLYRVVEVSGGVIDFSLTNNPGAWTMRGVTSNTFALVPESTKLDALNVGCAAGAVACQQVRLGASASITVALEPGTYKYYDPSQPGSGYGLLIVKP